MAAKTKSIGDWGEELARTFLGKKGLKVLGMRVRVDARSEIDLIARDGKILVFVEVKTRKSEKYGRPAESVDSRKRHYLSRAAVRYLKNRKIKDIPFRFDIVEVIGSPDGDVPEIRHIESAFHLDSCYLIP